MHDNCSGKLYPAEVDLTPFVLVNIHSPDNGHLTAYADLPTGLVWSDYMGSAPLCKVAKNVGNALLFSSNNQVAHKDPEWS